MLVCLMLAGVAGLGHAQEGAVKTGSQEGTLVVNYYSTAPDPELEHLQLLRQSTHQSVDRIMSNSSGFGGANVSVILEKA